MIPFPSERLDAILARHDIVTAQLASGEIDPEMVVQLSRELSDLDPVVAAIRVYRAALDNLAGLEALIDEPGTDSEMRALAAEEKPDAQAQLEDAHRALQLLLLPKDAADEKSAILEVRAGTGGDEAALFAGDLFQMLTRYAEQRGFKTDVLTVAGGDAGGYKEITFEIRGDGAYSVFKYESGVHRVQRVPATESQGRIHTSTATVAVLPEAEEVDVDVNPTDLRIDVFRSGGHGGQSVNTTDSAVRITHLPTGLVVTCQDERSQLQNKDRAMKILRARLFEAERERAQQEASAARLSQIGTGERSEKIRTYNYPQNRATDHRVNLDRSLETVLAGNLQPFTEALAAEERRLQLAAAGTQAASPA
jgi:peptide chain release factor 1